MNQSRQPGRVECPAPQAIAESAEPRQPGRVNRPTVGVAVEPANQTRTPSAGVASLWRRTGLVLLLSVLAWILAQTGLSLLAIWQAYWWLGLALSLLSVAAVLLLLRALYGEWQASRRLDALAQRQQQIAQALQQEDRVLFNQTLGPVLQQLSGRMPTAVAEYRELLGTRDTVAACVQLAENTWLAKLDQDADKLIQQEALTVGGAVALIPHPFFDGIIALWRSQRLVRRIATLYGLQPTGLSSWKLLKQVVLNTVIAAGMETATELAAEQLGYGVVESATGKGMVQGAVMLQRMRRLGKQAKYFCRPWN